ncbi:unnamed protein product [Trifolium pratense]|uniref:Uncharacterized protein n=1 Tax=Trifolium pratense TaxID=57577 RepID=A0ACB0JYN2_TRIPR|nr:unnamed protein product [Trifolium pratense]
MLLCDPLIGSRALVALVSNSIRGLLVIMDDKCNLVEVISDYDLLAINRISDPIPNDRDSKSICFTWSRINHPKLNLHCSPIPKNPIFPSPFTLSQLLKTPK